MIRFGAIHKLGLDTSFLVCVKSDKHAFWVTLRHLGSMLRGKTELCTLHDQARWSQAAYIRTHFSVSSTPQSWSWAVVCVSTPRMYPRSGYFLVYYILIFHWKKSRYDMITQNWKLNWYKSWEKNILSNENRSNMLLSGSLLVYQQV